MIYFETIIVIFTFAAILAALLNYPVRWLRRFLPRTVAVVLVFLASLLIITALTVTLCLTILSQGQQLIYRVLEIANFINSLFEYLESFLQTRNLQLDLDAIAARIRNLAFSVINYIISFLGFYLANFINIIFIAVITFFMLLNGKKVCRFVIKIVSDNSQNRFANTVKKSFYNF